MSKDKDAYQPTFHAPSQAAWREWLVENHATEKSVWLIIYKMDSGVESVYYDAAVDTALCFGWVDSSIRKRDGESYLQYFSARNPKSNWSRVNKEKIARLQAEGRLEPAGEEMVRIARNTGTWDALNNVEDGVIPDDLGAELAKYPAARAHFKAFPRSVKRGILEWILNAKREPTRAKRIAETARLAQDKVRANQYERK
ncbi:MAG: YdeI/OmpD-associated family protein [Saprospiraceae bacterium]